MIRYLIQWSAIACFCVLLTTSVSAQGIQFKKDKWEQILAEAGQQNKIIFVDAFTTWCGPCKKMSKEVFPQSKVGEFYNQHFINVKMDMEKGEGPKLAEQYGVQAYPTLLFIASDGSLVHRSAGYHDTDQFLQLGGIALDPRHQLGTMAKRFNEGERDPDFLFDYTKARFEAYDGSHERIAEAYLDTQEDWTDQKNQEFLFTYVNSAQSKLFDYLIEHRADFEQLYGQRTVAARVQELIYNSIYDSADKSSLTQIDELFAKVYPEEAGSMSARFRLTYYRQAGDREKYAESAVDYVENFKGQAPDELNEIAWTFYRVIEDEALLKKAVKWAKKSIKIDNQYYNNDTLAALYFKLGKKRKARKAAEKAIKLAAANNEDHSETDELLKRIQEM